MIQPGMTRRKRSEHYVNNKEFLAALVEYRTQVEVSYRKKFGEILLNKTNQKEQEGGIRNHQSHAILVSVS